MENLRRNFFNGNQEGDRKIAWVKWHTVLASKQYGGLGLSSFFALNRGLLAKWVWRFLSQDNSLWYRVISTIHVLGSSTLSAAYPSIWSSIINEFDSLKDQGVDVFSHCKIRIGNGVRTRFWKDCWIGESRLQGGAEAQQFNHLSTLLDPVILSNSEDRCVCDLSGDGEFRVKDVRNLLDEFFLLKADVPTRWEDMTHVFFNCTLAKDLTRLICRWWNLEAHSFSSYAEWLSWLNSLRHESKLKEILEGVFYVTWWSVWNFRNHMLFASNKPRKETIFDDIVLRSFNWCVARGQGFTFENEIFFNTSCITRMILSFCRFNPPNGAISWERLKCLCLCCVTLDEDMIEKILSGSPCLESLELNICFGYRWIDVTSKSVKKLFSKYNSYSKLVLRELVFLDVSSLIKTVLDYYMDRELDYSIDGRKSGIFDEEVFGGLLESLGHVKDITLGDY
uniref:RNA-directed DNA polymerase, eukaryota n=1 Tax=Tanacetum cinerariifolium TaxID=118510 RepID=A0A699I2T1_TANCI|nr:RNA-directed DNA polymerase, eukaryota [Tanacetum cinerariifolium]